MHGYYALLETVDERAHSGGKQHRYPRIVGAFELCSVQEIRDVMNGNCLTPPRRKSVPDGAFDVPQPRSGRDRVGTNGRLSERPGGARGNPQGIMKTAGQEQRRNAQKAANVHL